MEIEIKKLKTWTHMLKKLLIKKNYNFILSN